jgi:transcription termination/antitermination protein NusG
MQSIISSLQSPNVPPLAATLPWFALKVRTRSESFAKAILEEKGYECFSPTYQERRAYSDRTKVVDSAAFPGYLFCRFDPEHKVPVLNSPAVAYVLGCAGKLLEIPDAELDAIKRALNFGARPSNYFKIGGRVRVVRGPMAGMEGTLSRLNQRDTLFVSIQLLQRSVSMEIDAGMVESLES